MTPDVALFLIRVFAGLALAGHGAQKVFGVWGGPGLDNWTNNVAQMGFRPARAWAAVQAYVELLGGLALALGLLTPVAAALLAVNILAAIAKVHWRKGFWATKGGYEYPLAHLVIVVALGLAGPGAYAVDAALGLGAFTLPLFLVAGGVALIMTVAGMSEPARPEERDRRAA